MSKDPTPKADGLRAMREASRGHLQAHVVEEKSSDVMAEVKKMMKPAGYIAGAATAPAHAAKKLIPYAGKDPREGTSRHGGIPYSKNPKPDGPRPPRKRVIRKRTIA